MLQQLDVLMSVSAKSWGVVIDVAPGKTLTEEEVFKHCEGLMKYKRPRKVFFGEIPRNPTGKIEKVKLRKKFTGREEAFKL